MLSFEILKVTILERVMLTLYGSLCLLDDMILYYYFLIKGIFISKSAELSLLRNYLFWVFFFFYKSKKRIKNQTPTEQIIGIL